MSTSINESESMSDTTVSRGKRRKSVSNKKQSVDSNVDTEETNSSTEEKNVKKKTPKTQTKKVKRTKATGKLNKDEIYKKTRNDLYTWFYYNNKPVIMTELNLLFKDAGKKMLETLCEDLESKKLISIKLNGKTKVYFLNQETLKYKNEGETVENASNKMSCSIDNKTVEYKTFEELQQKEIEISEKYAEVLEINRGLLEEINMLSNALSDEEFIIKIEEFKKFLEENKEYASIETVIPEEFDKLKDKEIKIKKIHGKRNKIFKNVVETVSEAMGIKKKIFLEEAGIEE